MKNNQQESLKAKKIDKILEKHGHQRNDPYYWLNDRENPEVIAYIEAENAYTEAQMASTKKFQEKLYQEMVGRIKQTDESVPYFVNGYFYYSRFEEGQEYPIYCRKKDNLDSEEEIILNVNILAKDHEYYSVASLSVSDDKNILAFGVDTVGRRQYTIYFKNLQTGEIMADAIPLTTGGGVWSADNQTFFYTVKDEVTLRSHKILKHRLGTEISSDIEVFYEEDETFDTSIYRTKSKKYLVIASHSTLTSECRFLEANNPNGEFQIIQTRETEHEYSVDHFEEDFYIVSNWEAKNFRLMKTPVEKTEKSNWTEIIPNRDDILLEGLDIFKEYLVLSERKNGLNALRIIKWDDKSEHYLDFGEPAYTAWTSINPEFDTKTLRYGYSSMTTPVSTYDYNMETKEKTLLKQQEVVGDFKPSDYLTERLYATAQDGTKVPISLVYKKGIKKDSKNPLLLYGYGSYGISIDPYFSSVKLSLLDRGFVYAIAHIRGGEEMGRQWYEDGKMFKKKNTFTDFIDCVEYLIKENFTNPNHLFAYGGSAGGLLMGAVMNMRPDLFKGVIAAVPFVDVVTTMLDDSIPLTTSEYDEWGNPNNKDSYDYMLSYSPYDNVEKKDYPNLLITTGLHDSQVQYWEPAKWIARLREMKTDDNLLLMKTDMGAGHSGKTGRFKQYEDSAFEYAFLLKLAGIEG